MSDLSAFPIASRWPAKNPDIIQLYSLPTPNGVKASIMLEEVGLPYSVHNVNLMRGEQRELGLMRWGFKLPDRLLFNARAEGVADTKFWGDMVRERRCIVPASSFFEWRKTGNEPRPKYKLSVKGRGVFGMAGVWSPWMNPKTGQWEDTFSILTSDANGKMGAIHDRQPVILEPREYGEFITQETRDE